MKKILAIAIAVVMISAVCATVSFAADPATVITPEQLAAEGNTVNAATVELKNDDGAYVKVTSTGDDPWICIKPVPAVGADNKYATIKYRTTSTASKGIEVYTEIDEPHATTTETLNTDGKWHTIVIDLSTAGDKWKGNFSRLDMMNGAPLPAGEVIDIAWIALFANEADAKAYKGPSGSSETPVGKEKDPDFWLCKAGSTNIAPGYWMNDPYQGRNIDIKFTSTSAFNALLAQMYANAPGAEAGPCVVTIKVLDKDGKELESQDLEVSNDADGDGTKEAGDGIYTVNFKKTYEAGTYTISILPKSGQYFVLGGSEAGDGAVEVTGNFGTADQFIHEAPCAVLLGAVPGGSNPGTADAAVIAIAAVACIALAGVVVAKKIK